MRKPTLLLAGALLTSACYSVEPLATTKPVPGTRLSLSITDSGRVALGGSMGPQIRQVEGNLLRQQDNEYVLSMIGVNYLNGTFQKWAGETVRIRTDLVSGFYEKKFSTGRTIVFAVLSTAGVAMMSSRFNQKPSLPEDSVPGPGSQVRKAPIRLRFTLPR